MNRAGRRRRCVGVPRLLNDDVVEEERSLPDDRDHEEDLHVGHSRDPRAGDRPEAPRYRVARDVTGDADLSSAAVVEDEEPAGSRPHQRCRAGSPDREHLAADRSAVEVNGVRAHLDADARDSLRAAVAVEADRQWMSSRRSGQRADREVGWDRGSRIRAGEPSLDGVRLEVPAAAVGCTVLGGRARDRQVVDAGVGADVADAGHGLHVGQVAIEAVAAAVACVGVGGAGRRAALVEIVVAGEPARAGGAGRGAARRRGADRARGAAVGRIAVGRARIAALVRSRVATEAALRAVAGGGAVRRHRARRARAGSTVRGIAIRHAGAAAGVKGRVARDAAGSAGARGRAVRGHRTRRAQRSTAGDAVVGDAPGAA